MNYIYRILLKLLMLGIIITLVLQSYEFNTKEILMNSMDFTTYVTKNLQTIDNKVLLFNNSFNQTDIETSINSIDEEEIIKDDNVTFINTNNTIKNVYIYNTHQMEEYLDGYTVKDGALYLKELLEKAGMHVDLETNDFVAYGKLLGYGYKQLYSCSRVFLLEALEKKNYDLIIDFHRDALERDNTYVTYNGKDYAKLMIVVGTINDHYDDNYAFASTLYDNLLKENIPIIKPIYKQYARYNQDVSNKALLIEFGSQNNYFSEIKNSIEVLAKTLIAY